MYRTVAVGTDFSEPALAAARLAPRVAAPGARIHLVHVQSPLPRFPALGIAPETFYGGALPRLRREAEEALDAFARRAGLPDAERHVVEGAVAEGMDALAREVGADIVVVGARGQTRLETILLGSKARGILRGVRTDVLVARGDGSPPRRIGVATDFYPPAEAAGRAAGELAAHLGAQVELLHVVDTYLWGSLADDVANGRVPEAERERLEAALRRDLEAFNDRNLHGRAAPVQLHGAPERELVRRAEGEGLDLLVVGTHGPGAIERLLVGSVAEGVAERAPCSVLVARARPSTEGREPFGAATSRGRS